MWKLDKGVVSSYYFRECYNSIIIKTTKVKPSLICPQITLW